MNNRILGDYNKDLSLATLCPDDNLSWSRPGALGSKAGSKLEHYPRSFRQLTLSSTAVLSTASSSTGFVNSSQISCYVARCLTFFLLKPPSYALNGTNIDLN